MPIRVTKKVDFKKIQADIQANIKREFETALLDEAERISSRTRAGKDVEGKSFESYKPYDPKYKKWKQKKGRRGNIDLTLSGSMLAAIATKVEVTADKIKGYIFFSSAKEAEKAYWNQVDNGRPFFGLAKEQVKRLMQRLKEAMRK